MTGQAAADELEIRNLIARLAQVADDGVPEEYLELLTGDAEWSLPGSLPAGPEVQELRGPDAIIAAVRERRDDGPRGAGIRTRHVVSTTTVTVTGAVAATRTSWQYHIMDATPTLAGTGRYDDRLRRTPDGWRLARRVITRD